MYWVNNDYQNIVVHSLLVCLLVNIQSSCKEHKIKQPKKGKPLIVAFLKNNFPLYSELIICPQLHTLKVNEPLNKLWPLKDIKWCPLQCPCSEVYLYSARLYVHHIYTYPFIIICPLIEVLGELRGPVLRSLDTHHLVRPTLPCLLSPCVVTGPLLLLRIQASQRLWT